MAENVILRVEDIHKSFKHNDVLRGVTFELQENDFVVLYGLPGSGKSVLFRSIMGLESIDEGAIEIRGHDALPMLPGARNIGYVPQSFALFPDRSVHDNIGYPLTFLDMGRDEIVEAVESIAKMLQIQDHLQKLPSQLSGGQKQRVAIARGLVKKNNFYVLDDPLAGLDFKLREQLVDDLRRLQDQIGATFLYATSDPMESLSLAKRVLAIHDGRIVDDQDPHSIYATPHHRFSAERMSFPISNSLAGTIQRRGDEVTCDVNGLATLTLPSGIDIDVVDGQSVVAVFKPEDIELLTDESAVDVPTIRFNAEIQLREDLGGEQIVYLAVGDLDLRSVQRHEGDRYLDADHAGFQIQIGKIDIFDSETGIYITTSEERAHVRN